MPGIFLELLLQSSTVVVLGEEQSRTGANTQDQACDLCCLTVGGNNPPSLEFAFELWRVEDMVLVVGAIEPVINKDV